MSVKRSASIDRRRVLRGGGALAVTPLLVAGLAQAQAQAPSPGFPIPPRDGTVDVLHGVSIPDPFRPFEDASRADVQAWVAAMDGNARKLLNDDPVHGRVLTFLRAAGTYHRPFPPRHIGPRLFSIAFDGTTEQARLVVTDSPRVRVGLARSSIFRQEVCKQNEREPRSSLVQPSQLHNSFRSAAAVPCCLVLRAVSVVRPRSVLQTRSALCCHPGQSVRLECRSSSSRLLRR